MRSPRLIAHPLIKPFALAKTGLKIPYHSLVTPEQPLEGTETDIIAQIHAIRFHPANPYVITGAHYSDLYIRNLGIFFNALLDPRLPTPEQDWKHRQEIALKTVRYDLVFLQQHQKAVTTIVPLGHRLFTGLNIYRPPSDAMYGILYTLNALIDGTYISKLFPICYQSLSAHVSGKNKTYASRALMIKSSAELLLKQYRTPLSHALVDYLLTSLDPETNLVRTSIQLSSARDGVKRCSAFYDNVIAWATVKAARQLGFTLSHLPDLESWKQLIINAFWDETVGIFKDELTESTPVFSADSLIVTSTGFFDLEKKTDRTKLERIITYVHQEKLDQPFPLKYSRVNNHRQMHWAVRWFAPSYMGQGIWSHWGMEYIKSLILLSDKNNDRQLLDQARHHLAAYKHNIERFGGYPELYNPDGTPFRSPLMRSVLHTGWVVNYEQAKMMAGIYPST